MRPLPAPAARAHRQVSSHILQFLHSHILTVRASFSPAVQLLFFYLYYTFLSLSSPLFCLLAQRTLQADGLSNCFSFVDRRSETASTLMDSLPFQQTCTIRQIGTPCWLRIQHGLAHGLARACNASEDQNTSTHLDINNAYGAYSVMGRGGTADGASLAKAFCATRQVFSAYRFHAHSLLVLH